MDFGSGGNSEAKAWKDIWGSGQGIGAVKAVKTVAEFVDQLEAEYRAAKASLDARYFGVSKPSHLV
jgi:nitronate monooxygenase